MYIVDQPPCLDRAGRKEENLKMKEFFIKNILDVDVDAMRQRNRYIVRALYDVEQPGGFYKLDQRTIEDLTLTWDEIEQEGGIAEVNKQFKECYNV